MNLRVEMDTKGLEAQLNELSQKSLAFATVNALNNVAKVVQKVEREKLDEKFEVRTDRTRRFLEREVAKIKPFANVRDARPYVEISVGQRKRLLLSVFEKGGEKESARGAKLVGVPVTGGPARKTFSSPVAETLYLRKLKFRAKKTKSGRVQYRGKDRTFLLKKTAQATHGGVFQRVGPAREDVRMVYSFKQRPRLKAVLRFVETADRVARTWLRREFEDQLRREIARAAAKR